MKLGIITQNTIEGGLDTFLINFINNLPNVQIVLFYNTNKNIDKFENYLKNKNIEIFRYDFSISNNFSSNRYRIVKKILNIYFFTINIFFISRKLSKIFKRYNFDNLLVVNGGYPGGEVCLSAIIGWALLKHKNKAWLNVHNYPISIKNYSLVRKFYENYIDKKISNNISGLITVSNSCKKEFIFRPNLDYSKIHYIHNGYDRKNFKNILSLKNNINIKSSDKIVLLPAVFEHRKGQHVAIRAFNDILKFQNNIHLILCGDGLKGQKYKMIELINKFNLSKNIHILPFNKSIETLYKQCDVVIIPSLYMESFGYTAIEAMSFKIPVIASSIGGLNEIIINNITGYLIEPNNHKEFSKKIRSIINNDALREKLSIEGYRRYLEFFSSKLMTEKYMRMFDNKK